MPHIEENASFSAPPEEVTAQGLLFDMDGTIIDSTDAIVKHWHTIGKELGVDPNVILQTSHGRRSIDVLKEYDPSRANWEYVSEIESVLPKKYGNDAVEIKGSRALLDQMEKAGAPWAIVTSGTRALVNGWLDVMKLAHPKFLVAAEDVKNGKPDPAGYRSGREKLTLPDTASVIVFEDAPAGVKAGRAAGARVVGLATSHTLAQLREAGADWIVEDMRSVTLQSWDTKTGDVTIRIANALVA